MVFVISSVSLPLIGGWGWGAEIIPVTSNSVGPKSGFAASQASTVGGFYLFIYCGVVIFPPVSGARER